MITDIDHIYVKLSTTKQTWWRSTKVQVIPLLSYFLRRKRARSEGRAPGHLPPPSPWHTEEKGMQILAPQPHLHRNYLFVQVLRRLWSEQVWLRQPAQVLGVCVDSTNQSSGFWGLGFGWPITARGTDDPLVNSTRLTTLKNAVLFSFLMLWQSELRQTIDKGVSRSPNSRVTRVTG